MALLQMEADSLPNCNDDVDEARPEATFIFKVRNFSSIKDSVLSEPCIVRNLPWKIMIMPRPSQNSSSSPNQKSMGYFLQCNGESEASSWSCQASAELRVLKHNGDEHFSRKINHLFYSKENDWGFSHYMSWNDVADPEKGFISDDSVTFEVKVSADAPHGVSWDSKKHTGYVGLKNQGATCYMNSLLQVLYFSNALRRNVYKMPTEADDSSKSVALALQRVFHDLQFLDKAVGTKKLTKSFGWEALDSFMQHDVQEFLRVLLDKLEMKMKDTVVEGTIPKLFEGKMISYIKCKNVDVTSSRTESFYDIQLNIKGKKNILESFSDYVKTELLEGENKYDAGSFGLQEAEKGILFESFPPILHLHLMRFQYDPLSDSSVKFNDRFEFSELLDLSSFQKSERSEHEEGVQVHEGVENENVETLMEIETDNANIYILHAVLVHSGDNNGGHYVVFINPSGDGKWCKFDDDVVCRCTSEEAIQNNFGGSENEESNGRQSTNAYMLVYIRKTQLQSILCDVSNSDIPLELLERLEREKKMEIARRKEKSEAHLHMVLRLVTEDHFRGHQGYDLYDPERVLYQELRVKKSESFQDLLLSLSSQMKVKVEQMRLWPLNHRTNQTLRPALIDTESDLRKSVFEVADNANPWTVFLELGDPESEDPLPPFDKEQDVNLFLKYYDPVKERIHYMGHLYVSITSNVSSMIPELLRRANLNSFSLSASVPSLIIHEEIKPNMLEKICDFDKPLESVLEELMDGDIVVFQKYYEEDSSEAKALRLPSCRDYFRDLFYKVDVTFIDKNIRNDPGVTLVLSQRMLYSAFSKAVASKLDMDPNQLQFFKSQSYREAPSTAIRCSFEGTLKDLLTFSRPKHPKTIFYQKLSIPIHELENKRQLKVSWVPPGKAGGGVGASGDDETRELTLYPSKTGKVTDLLLEACLKIESEESGNHRNLHHSSSSPSSPSSPSHSPSSPLIPHHYRLVEIVSHKILNVTKGDTLIDSLSSTQTKTYRIEEIPREQMTLEENEALVPVAHFHKEVYSTFGSPFLIKIKEGLSYLALKEQLIKSLFVSEKEFEKYRIAVVSLGRPKYLDESETLKLKDFMTLDGSGNNAKPWIGLEHVNKSSKRARYNYMEKAIKIYN